MKTLLLILALAVSSSAHAAIIPGSFQWVLQTFDDLPTACAALAAGSADAFPPVMIETNDSVARFGVFRWVFADVTILPPGFVCFIGEEVTAVKDYKDWKSAGGYRHIGVVTTGDHTIAVAWYTHD